MNTHEIIINQTCKQGGFFMNLTDYIDQYDFTVRIIATVIIALAIMIPLTIYTFGKKKEVSNEENYNKIYKQNYFIPKQEITQTDYQMTLDSMLLFGVINSRQYQEYLTNGLPYFHAGDNHTL